MGGFGIAVDVEFGEGGGVSEITSCFVKEGFYFIVVEIVDVFE